MSGGRPLLAATSSNTGAQGNPSGGGSKQPGGSGSKPKRTLIESACAACRRRKSRCDGQRPACSRCQALQTECTYQAEEGESRWSALRRRTHTYEKERDDLRELLALIQSRPEPEAQEIFRNVRANTYGGDVGALVRQIRNGVLAAAGAAQAHQQPAQSMFAQPGAGQTPASAHQLPPLRSMVEVPPSTSGGGAMAPPSIGRHDSRASAGSDGSGMSGASGLSGSWSGSGPEPTSLSPRDVAQSEY